MSIIYKFKLFINPIVLLSSLLISSLYSEECDLNSFEIIPNFFNDDIVAYYLNAIDVNSGTSNILLFDYTIRGSENCYISEDPVNLILQFSMNVFSPSIGFNSSQEFFNGKIGISNISSEIRFNNMDLNYNTRSVPGAEFSMIDYSGPTDINSNDVQLIISSILTSGKIPNGLYSFNFQLISSEDNMIITELTKTINVNEPEYINLISPGGSVSDTSNNIIYSTFPVFTWNSDNCSSCATQIRVCEFNPSDLTTTAGFQ